MSQIFYERMRDVASRLTTKYKTGTITLRRFTSAEVGSSEVWTQDLQDARTHDDYVLDAVVLGVTEEYIKDTTVTMDDLMVITSPIASKQVGPDFVPIDNMEYDIADELRIDDNIHRIKKIERIPAAGQSSGFIIYVCS